MRKLIHISGNESWCLAISSKLIRRIPITDQTLIYLGAENNSAANFDALTISNSTKRSFIENLLGSQSSALIVNCYNGFNPELFCALCGTVKSPGLIILITPRIEHWHTFSDPDYEKLCSHPFTIADIKGRFIQYFTANLDQYTNTGDYIRLTEPSYTDELLSALISDAYKSFSEAKLTDNQSFTATIEQQDVINWVRQSIHSQYANYLVLTGKRGRGKSTILGQAINTLISCERNRSLSIVIVSQTRTNVEQITQQIDTYNLKKSNTGVRSNVKIKFMPADEFLLDKPKVSLLIIDEAASIPLPQLSEITVSNSSVILSTTLDGYEGSGMGFSNKLEKLLCVNPKRITHLKLTHPLRWPENDVIEKILEKCFIPSEHSPPIPVKDSENFKLEDLSITRLNRDELITKHSLVYELFKLLAIAHYRTTPDDLRYFLDAPGVEIWAAFYQQKIYATLIVATEGNIEQEFIEPIWLGERRLKGHLIPQSLCAQSGFKQACQLSYKRILRIAVKTDCQNRGMGTHLLNTVIRHSLFTKQTDFIGASFGIDKALIAFWEKNDFFAVRHGHKANARSGLKSIIMLNSLSARAHTLMSLLETYFARDMEYLTSQRLIHPASIKNCTLTECSKTSDDNTLDCQEKADMYTFAFGKRQFAHCARTLYKYANHALNQAHIRNQLDDKSLHLLTLKVLQNKSWALCCRLTGLSGNKQAQFELRQIYKIIYTRVWGNKS